MVDGKSSIEFNQGFSQVFLVLASFFSHFNCLSCSIDMKNLQCDELRTF